MDSRKDNGGHSTKSKTGLDKRKNEYKNALEMAASVDDVVQVINVVKNKALEKQDINAAKIFLEYYLGKPKESLDVTSEQKSIDFNELLKFGRTDNSTS